MPRTGSGSATRRRNVAVLRGAGFVAAVVLDAIAIWLIVTSSSQKSIEIGVLTGLWGLALGVYSMYGSRSPAREAAPAAPAPAAPGQALDVRQIGEIERAAVAAARLEFQAELQEMLRREIQAGLADEVAGLRAEVAALRNELLEKVGGQLRLERIETTRLIGSDLEALQNELRQLRQVSAIEAGDDDHVTVDLARDAAAVAAAATGPIARTPATVQPATGAPVEIHEAEIVVERVDATPTQATTVQSPQPEESVVSEPQPANDAEPVEPATPERVPAQPAPFADPFANLPRITPFTDFELDPIPSAPQTDDEDEAGRHATGDEDGSTRGRRHRADDSKNDTLARILARENR